TVIGWNANSGVITNSTGVWTFTYVTTNDTRELDFSGLMQLTNAQRLILGDAANSATNITLDARTGAQTNVTVTQAGGVGFIGAGSAITALNMDNASSGFLGASRG